MVNGNDGGQSGGEEGDDGGRSGELVVRRLHLSGNKYGCGTLIAMSPLRPPSFQFSSNRSKWGGGDGGQSVCGGGVVGDSGQSVKWWCGGGAETSNGCGTLIVMSPPTPHFDHHRSNSLQIVQIVQNGCG